MGDATYIEFEQIDWSDDDGSTFCKLTITWANGEEETHHFASYFDSGNPHSAVEQAASFLGALEESLSTTLEERLEPFGTEWQREQEGRDMDDLPF